jgi:secondary thiamine-phosphate synthase enzyme
VSQGAPRAAIGIASKTLAITTAGQGFTDVTAQIAAWLRACGAEEGTLTVFVRHTSASLTIQENADPAVRADLTDALERLAPQHARYRHDTEGPDDMPAHIKAMLTAASLSIPVIDGSMVLGTWQGIYVIEHRDRPHQREIVVQFVGRAG